MVLLFAGQLQHANGKPGRINVAGRRQHSAMLDFTFLTSVPPGGLKSLRGCFAAGGFSRLAP